MIGEIEYLAPLEVILLLSTFFITVAVNVQPVVSWYRVQTSFLALIIAVVLFEDVRRTDPTGFGPHNIFGLLALALMLMLLLALILAIKLALKRATLAKTDRGFWLSEPEQREAMRIWYKQSRGGGISTRRVLPFMLLAGLAFLTAHQMVLQSKPFSTLGLAISLSLVLIGLYNMIDKSDLISQVIGLLVMDHGMFLSAIRLVSDRELLLWFVISLLFYTLITIYILTILLPNLRQHTHTIDLDQVAADSELQG